MKILVVEDENALREVIVRSLEKERYVVESASSFREASLKINDYDYDCIVLDIMLPGGSGLTLLKELRALRKKDSIIIISAKDSIEDKVTGLDLGADDYLTKPIGTSELLARIRAAIERRENVAVFGDYDVDGITSTCVLTDYLRRRGVPVHPYIPDRIEEGYGLNMDAITSLQRANDITLIITVDCGITAIDETNYALQRGIDMVITDT